MRNGPKRIALAFTIGLPHVERILRGILDYARQRGPWHLDFNPETGGISIASLRHWRGDGIIGMLHEAAEERRAAALGVPVVNVSSAPLAPRLPSVRPDNRMVGVLAARHLLDRGFRRFAYYGLRNVGYGRDRGAGFVETLKAAGWGCDVLFDSSQLGGAEPWRWDSPRLVRWLGTLEPPVGIMAVHDYRGRMLIEAATALGLRVPQDVAVVGVNDDPVTCEFSEPSLTSVPLPGRDVGYRAAWLLDQLMRRRAVPRGPVLVAPAAIVPRGSTDVLGIPDDATATAVRVMTAHLDWSIAAVAGEVKLSRRSLEMRFRQWLGTTPYDHLCRLRVAEAKRLLAEPERLKLTEIARRSGFADPRRLNEALVRIEGRPARALRERQPH